MEVELWVNTIITVFSFCNIARDLRINCAWEVGGITVGNIPGTDSKNSYYCIYCIVMFKIYQREAVLF